jgi:predicted metal-binding protein
VNNHSTLQSKKTVLRLKEITQMALRIGAGAIDVAAISTSDISVEDDLANMCRESRCQNYGLSTNCPPYVSGPSGFRDLLKLYEYALFIKIDVPMENLLSYERRDIGKLLHEIVAAIEISAVKMGCSNAKSFAGGSCKNLFCRDHPSCCVLKEGGECRHSQQARPSMSGFGINVSKLKETAGWSMNPDASMGAFYGLILIG